MPKLQFLTANLIDGDGKLIPECVPKSSYSCKSLTVRCQIPSNGSFSVRLSSGPLPFDTVVKLFLNGKFLTGRCFLSGSIEPILDYEINHYVHHHHLHPLAPSAGFRFVWPYSKIQITIHKCVVNQQTPTQASIASQMKDGSTNFENNMAPVIIREDLNSFLEIIWDCRAGHSFITSK